jgi:hypothetical protein
MAIKQKFGICPDCKHDRLQPVIAGRCRTHYWQYRDKVNREKEKKKSNGITQKDIFLEIWNESKTKTSVISGRSLMPFFLKYLEGKEFNQFNWCFAHVIAKGVEKSLKLVNENILLVHPEEHTLLDQGTKEKRTAYEKEWKCSFDIFYERKEMLKIKYKIK